MARKRLMVSINSCWNFVNFRTGLIQALIAEGYEVIAAAPRDSHCERVEALGCRFVAIPLSGKGMSPVGDFRLFLSYLKIIRREKPDVFIGFTIKPNIYGSLAAHLCRVPVINNVAGLGTAFIRKSWLTLLAKTLYRAAFRRSRVVFFQNRDDLDEFVKGGIAAASTARLLPGSGIDLARFRPTARRSSGRVFNFLFVGRVLADKGVREYVAAARSLRRRLPHARFQLLGPLGVENRTAVSAAEVEKWSAEGIVDYLGQADDVRSFIAAADCIVLPSYREGLPRSLLEGAAMAKPLIATDVPGCRAVIEHGANGFLCTVRDAAALAEAMLRMALLPTDTRAAFGASARAKVEAGFSQDIVIARYLEAVEASVL